MKLLEYINVTPFKISQLEKKIGLPNTSLQKALKHEGSYESDNFLRVHGEKILNYLFPEYALKFRTQKQRRFFNLLDEWLNMGNFE